MKPGIEIVKVILEGLIKVIPMIRARRKQRNAPAEYSGPTASEMRAKAREVSERFNNG